MGGVGCGCVTLTWRTRKGEEGGDGFMDVKTSWSTSWTELPIHVANSISGSIMLSLGDRERQVVIKEQTEHSRQGFCVVYWLRHQILARVFGSFFALERIALPAPRLGMPTSPMGDSSFSLSSPQLTSQSVSNWGTCTIPRSRSYPKFTWKRYRGTEGRGTGRSPFFGAPVQWR